MTFKTGKLYLLVSRNPITSLYSTNSLGLQKGLVFTSFLQALFEDLSSSLFPLGIINILDVNNKNKKKAFII